jgi:hypothetical protein
LPQAAALQNTRRCALVRSTNHSVQSDERRILLRDEARDLQRDGCDQLASICEVRPLDQLELAFGRNELATAAFPREQLVQRRDLLAEVPGGICAPRLDPCPRPRAHRPCLCRCCIE